MNNQPYGRAGFRVVLKLGTKEYEISQAETDFALNTIPMAYATPAVGREVRSLKPAPVHEDGHRLQVLEKAELFLEAKGKHSPTEDWPEARTRIFDGYYTGQGYRKSNGNTQLTLSLIHWLSDMQFSSALSESSHPTNHQEYTFRASLQTAGVGSAGSSRNSLLSQYRASELFDTGNITSDLFGKAIKPFFEELCRADMIFTSGRLSDCGVGREIKKNDQALAALTRFDTAKPWSTPLSLALGGASRSLASGIQQTIVGRLVTDADFFQSLWDILIGKLAPMFMFAVVPRIDGADVAPVIAGLRPLYDRKITVTDQDFVDLSASIPRPLRGVGIYCSRPDGVQTKMTEDTLAPDPDAGIGGCYLPKSPDGKPLQGMFLIKAAPPWLANVASAALDARDSLGFTSATTPGAAGPKASPSPSDRVREAVDVYGDYAKAMYIQEALRGRQGVVSGKIRFDIAPGSNVWVEGSSEKFIGEGDKLGANLVGMVMKVTNGFNAETSKAGSGFQLGYVRTEEENQNDRLSTETHPLYKNAFKGAPLSEAYRFA